MSGLWLKESYQLNFGFLCKALEVLLGGGRSFHRACRGVKFFFFLTAIAQATFRNKPEKEEWEGSCGTSWMFASKAL